MKRIWLLLISLFFNAAIGYAQYYNPDRQSTRDSTDWKQKLFYGGNGGLSFGSNYAYIELSPMIGYRISSRLSAGTTLTYIFLKNKIFYNVYSGNTFLGQTYYNYESHIFGAAPFSRFFITDWLFVHGEYDIYNALLTYKSGSNPEYIETRRDWITFPLAGGGVSLKLGEKSGLLIMALYNFQYQNVKNKLPLYQSPIVLRVGFFF